MHTCNLSSIYLFQSKQQELTAQLQLAQHALTLNILINQGREDARDRHTSGTYSSDGSLKENHEHASPPHPRVNGSRSSGDDATPIKGEEDEETESLLYAKHQCHWPGCGRDCSSPGAWRTHMVTEHAPGERSRAQARTQMQIITQLEHQLSREKEVLTAMMRHLHPDPHYTTGNRTETKNKYYVF